MSRVELMQEAEALHHARDWRALIALYEHAMPLYSTPLRRDAAWFNIALCYLELGETANATRILRRLARESIEPVRSGAAEELVRLAEAERGASP
ncbi:MAG: hypothetical protein VYE22_14815 [Myxococcota bacterium]|nr:hypothetical protein [Myxococcota bacterium]